MDAQNLVPSRENHKKSAFTIVKIVPNELTQISVLDRFRTLLKQREDDVPPPTTDEIVQLYEIVLSELTFNCKPIITDLTIIAGELREHGKGIADAICARIMEVPVEQKLPLMYLLDSIVKNIGREYVKYFSTHIPQVFCEAYSQVHPDLYPAMRHLFGTWSAIFPPPVLHKIEAQLQFSSPVKQPPSELPSLRLSESPQLTRGTHVNSKYFLPLNNSSVDTNVPHAGGSSTLQIYAEEPSIGAIVRDEEPSEWRRKHYPNDNQNRLEISAAYKRNNGVDQSGARALIDAYGNDSREQSSNKIPLQVECLEVNGLRRKANTMSWQNTEEEEFDWEDMSPALADCGRNNDLLPSSIPPFRSLNARPSFGAQSGIRLEPHMRNGWSGQVQPSAVDDSAIIADDSVPLFGFGRGSTSKIPNFINDKPNVSSRYPQDPRKMSDSPARPSQYHPNLKGRGRGFHMPSLGSISSSGGETTPPFVNKLPELDSQVTNPLTVMSRVGSSTESKADAKSVIPASAGLRPPLNMHNSRPQLIFPTLTMQNQRLQHDFNSGYIFKNQGPNGSLNISEPNQNSGLIPVNQLNQLRTSLQPQVFPVREAREHFLSSAVGPVPPHMVASNLGHAYTSEAHGAVVPAINNNLNSSLHLQDQRLMPVPPCHPPSQRILLPANNAGATISVQQPGSAFSGLFSSLMAQGLISLTKPSTAQDSLGIEFNPDILKLHHESSINSLYGDLPRQCTTCGLRFKCQEEHSSHMDWHVTKNRMSKNLKQKASRKWFVSASMWLSGAEALGTDAVPGFLPTEPAVEKKANDEMAVPADEDQNVCALCGEPFEDFYSDETEEWMYKGAVYLNASDGPTAGMDRSQLGPIVHAKCRSQSSLVPLEGFGCNEEGVSDEGSQRKRLRS